MGNGWGVGFILASRSFRFGRNVFFKFLQVLYPPIGYGFSFKDLISLLFNLFFNIDQNNNTQRL